jgi:cellulose synthase/poly-beta-1,6-N-acetylglucosamine synthase-like glycosyltransferase
LYPQSLIEIIIVNDHSTDSTLSVINTFKNCTIIDLPDPLFGKKAAITQAVKQAQSDLIILRDADTFTHCNLWLSSIVHFYQTTKFKLIAAPLLIKSKNNLLNRFQELETLALNSTTAAFFQIKNPILCNGANLCFEKKVFEEVAGYTGNENISSGDDIFLLAKIQRKYKGETGYLKQVEATVYTKGEDQIQSFFNQKIRWAGKTKYNKNKLNLFLSL